ncbi:MAG: membrane-bound O-acyltransferase family protein [Candidatus Andersenbacteria bacterium CG10_big_fil_rev_8_21_14_0_10_54_11]|uniref:Membrane-bound O-acyltransferase family protein n=1 Tax=Candidatus Andersenbacteria bacterium CG10_big_fil_rev_8_21_14_0_10_54_11 TaxID=1974485 RepID=A0A2M6WZS4_9BACT|nr:MAG: membrane-bound O-acyltransferase family protein [Candidatus Andersenbacteria bacterium CG10_big_fil_rev_8_21_14_0_10_54_11]
MPTLTFNTPWFFLFFAAVYLIYLALPRRKQNYVLLAASYLFYASWDWRFVGLIAFSTILDYGIGLKLHQTDNRRYRQAWLICSVAINLGVLGFFKYVGFFAANLQHLAATVGLTLSLPVLHIILPVGISFYTFQTISYTIDIYRHRLNATRNLADFALFVAFFPQLVAGPIERASRLLPQIAANRRLTDSRITHGTYLILWGLFKKIVVADTLAELVDPVFAAPPPYRAAAVLMALYAFAWQIYSDFSGYTDIARGISKLMGFELMLNFDTPYLAANPQEFWRRWHISLSSWLRDYVYIPLGGSRYGRLATVRNLFTTIVLGGLWHGAAWTFMAWGTYHGLLLLLHRLLQPVLRRSDAITHTVWKQRVWLGVRIGIFFHLTLGGWLLFRAESLRQAFVMLASLEHGLQAQPADLRSALFGVALILPVAAMHIKQWHSGDRLILAKLPLLNRLLYTAALLIITLFVTQSGNAPETARAFIYFQF